MTATSAALLKFVAQVEHEFNDRSYVERANLVCANVFVWALRNLCRIGKAPPGVCSDAVRGYEPKSVFSALGRHYEVFRRFSWEAETNPASEKRLVELQHQLDRELEHESEQLTSRMVTEIFSDLLWLRTSRSKHYFEGPQTPAPVRKLLVELAGIRDKSRVADVWCHAGELLSESLRKANDLDVRGWSYSTTEAWLATMALVLDANGIFQISQENFAYVSDDGEIPKFDFVVSNLPFGFKLRSRNESIYDGLLRSVTLESEFNFILPALNLLKNKGRAAFVVPSGALFRGGGEASVRQRLTNDGILEAVIGLPGKIFPSTAIAPAIVVFDKGRRRDTVRFVDAGQVAESKRHQFNSKHVSRIIEACERNRICEFARDVSIDEIGEQEYNWSPGKYIDLSVSRQDPEELEKEVRVIQAQLSELNVKYDELLRIAGGQPWKS